MGKKNFRFNETFDGCFIKRKNPNCKRVQLRGEKQKRIFDPLITRVASISFNETQHHAAEKIPIEHPHWLFWRESKNPPPPINIKPAAAFQVPMSYLQLLTIFLWETTSFYSICSITKKRKKKKNIFSLDRTIDF